MKKQHRCKECGSVQLHPEKIICEACRAKRIKPKRKCEICGAEISGNRKMCDECKPKKIVRICIDCGKPTVGKSTRCPACKEMIYRIRERARHKKHFHELDIDAYTPKPVTSLEWLDKFKGCGIDYGRKNAPVVTVHVPENLKGAEQ